ncbi:hypothetical protein HDU98_004570 [Podochytrium sp. JEL0797]|nr:hypothetical protein HDU98_004570 [Podochytrium sp. JEL0797]
MRFLVSATFAVACEAAAVTMPIKRASDRRLDPMNAMANTKRRYNLTLPLLSGIEKRDSKLNNFSDMLYTTAVSFGNGQTFNVDLDTGSSDVWVRGSNCVSSDGSCGVAGQKAFDVTDGTCGYAGGQFSVSYGSGSVTGNVYTGPVTLGGVTATINFGVTTKGTGFNSASDGLWGLAYTSLNQITSGNFASASGISSFAFYLSDSVDGDSGTLTMNGVDPSKYSGTMSFVPITSKTYYQFDPTGASFIINGMRVSMTGTRAIADTGTTLILAPAAIAAYLNTAIGAGAYNPSKGLYPIDCSIFDTGAPLTVQIGSASITVGSQQYVLSNGDGTCTSGISQIGSAALGSETPEYIFGDVFLRAAYTLFDIQNSRLGFAQAVHPTVFNSKRTKSQAGVAMAAGGGEEIATWPAFSGEAGVSMRSAGLRTASIGVVALSLTFLVRFTRI